MKIDIKEGVYRIFIILSACMGLFFLLYCYGYWGFSPILSILAGLVCACLVYVSYFVGYWIVDGFCKINNTYDEKNVIFLFFKNYKDFKFLLFIFTLCVALFLGSLLFLSEQRNSSVKIELSSCKNSNYSCEKMLKAFENTGRELDLCKDKLRGVLNYKTEEELLNDVDAYSAKDYNPDM